MIERGNFNQDSTVNKSSLKNSIAERLTRHFVPEIEVSGSRHLHEVEERLAGMRPVIMIANHLSHADAPVLASALKRKGFDEIADKLVFMLGIRMKSTPVLNKILDSYSYIPVWPPTIIPKNKKENAESLGMAKKAIIAARENLKNGKVLVIFPEGSRSRNGQLSTVKRVMAHYMLEMDDSFVVPVGISGSEKVLPIGNVIPKKGSVKVSFGNPVDINYLNRTLEGFSKKEKHQLSVDYLMRQVADLLPDEYKGFYA